MFACLRGPQISGSVACIIVELSWALTTIGLRPLGDLECAGPTLLEEYISTQGIQARCKPSLVNKTSGINKA